MRCVCCRGLVSGRGLVCSGCWVAMPWLGAPLCRRCGLPEPCGARCPAARWAFTSSWAPVDYAGPVIALVRALKERGAYPVADLMAATIVAGVPESSLRPGAVLVPVPADPWRRRVRGIDHAAVLAQAVARRTGHPVVPALRRSLGARQAGRDRKGRIAAGLSVHVAAGEVGPHVVLVDDVHTTGATLHAAASALHEAGVKHMDCLTFARSI